MIMRTTIVLVASAPILLTSGCGKQDQSTSEQRRPANELAVAVAGNGVGTITAINISAGRVTLDHGRIPEAGWPAMTMAFDADSALLESFRVGDKVKFKMTTAGGTPRVISMQAM